MLSGHPALGVTLQQPGLDDISQRIVVQYQLSALPDQEIGPFIQHRLTIAGGERQDIFPPDVVERIGFYSQGIPRLINVICDNALLVAYTLSQEAVSVENIEEVALDLNLLPNSEEEIQDTATDDIQDAAQPLRLASSAGVSAFGGSAPLPAISQERLEASAEAPVETGLMFLEETNPDLASNPTEEAPPSFRFAPPHQENEENEEHPESASGESDTLVSASPEQPQQSEQSANKVSPSDIPKPLETNTWAASDVPADEIAQTVSDEGGGEVQDSWEDNREDDQEDNWESEGSQEEPVEFIIAPQHEPAQSSRSSWPARIGIAGVLLLVFGGVGYAMSSQSSPDWLSTLQAKAASLLDSASLSTLTQVWSSDPSPNKQPQTVAAGDVPGVRNERAPDQSPALSSQEQRLALVEQDDFVRDLGPIQNPIQNEMEETPIAAQASLEAAPKEQTPVENMAVETLLPHAREQQAAEQQVAQSSEAPPAQAD